MLLDLNKDNLNEIVSNKEIVIVQFSASWCGNCRIMKPKFKKMAVENNSIRFLIIDAEKNPISRKLANVDNLPTFAFFNNGELYSQIQTNKADILLNFVNEAANH